MLSAEEREKKRNQIAAEIVTTKQITEELGISRMRLSQYVSSNRIRPITRGIYLKDDIIAFTKAFEEARENKTWLREFE